MDIEMNFHTNINKFAYYVENMRKDEAINYEKKKKYLQQAQRAAVELTSCKKELSCEKKLIKSV